MNVNETLKQRLASTSDMNLALAFQKMEAAGKLNSEAGKLLVAEIVKREKAHQGT